MGDMAFKSTVSNDDLVDDYIMLDGQNEPEYVPPESEINDSVVSTSLTWSSDKIETIINGLLGRIAALEAKH